MAKIFYHVVPVPWRQEEKYALLQIVGSVAGVKWKTLQPDKKGNPITTATGEEFNGFLPIGKIACDPNRMDDEEYIVRVIGLVIAAGLEAMQVIQTLPEVDFD